MYLIPKILLSRQFYIDWNIFILLVLDKDRQYTIFCYEIESKQVPTYQNFIERKSKEPTNIQ